MAVIAVKQKELAQRVGAKSWRKELAQRIGAKPEIRVAIKDAVRVDLTTAEPRLRRRSARPTDGTLVSGNEWGAEASLPQLCPLTCLIVAALV